MAIKYEIVQATEEHAKELAMSIRQADKDEVWASHHLEPLEALQLSMQLSRGAQVGLADGKAVCMFGVWRFSALSDVGSPWLFTSEELPKHAREFLRRNKAYIRRIREEYRLLVNFVDARNKVAIRWLKWLGFKLDDPTPYGADQLPFHRFEMRGTG